jgi:hypothetical protein
LGTKIIDNGNYRIKIKLVLAHESMWRREKQFLGSTETNTYRVSKLIVNIFLAKNPTKFITKFM